LKKLRIDFYSFTVAAERVCDQTTTHTDPLRSAQNRTVAPNYHRM
jgi:hypothetical protein